MLIEIKCDIFKKEKITFHKGLNVVLGDNDATNSIGKSTLLMILDFIFGGNTYLTHNSDVIKEIRHHDFKFSFEFEDKRFSFIRSTINPNYLSICNDKYDVIDSITLHEYTRFLKEKYDIKCKEVSFRTVVSRYSRIWGKNNYDVKRPLHSFSSQKNIETVNELIKLFNKYSEIKNLTTKIQKEKETKGVLTKATKHNYLPKITKKKFKENQKKIGQLEQEISEIKNEVNKHVLNINELTNKEILELKIEKDKLLNIKNNYEYKLKRVKKNMNQNSSIKDFQLQELKEFFPAINIGKIAKIEEFHKGISKILSKELKETEREIINRINVLNGEIYEIDRKIIQVLSNVENPGYIVEKIYDLTSELNTLKKENSIYEKKESLANNLKSMQEEIKEIKENVLSFIETKIYKTMVLINKIIHGHQRKSPYLALSDNNYDFQLLDDTGTGKAYTNLLIFDLAIFQLTNLPILIHDSLLFKNIENSSVNNIVAVYDQFNKQIFISIDEITKYSKSCSKTLNDKKVIELDKNNLLFIKDWRK